MFWREDIFLCFLVIIVCTCVGGANKNRIAPPIASMVGSAFLRYNVFHTLWKYPLKVHKRGNGPYDVDGIVDQIIIDSTVVHI